MYGVADSVHFLHPKFDDILFKILTADKVAHILFIDTFNATAGTGLYKERLEKCWGESYQGPLNCVTWRQQQIFYFLPNIFIFCRADSSGHFLSFGGTEGYNFGHLFNACKLPSRGARLDFFEFIFSLFSFFWIPSQWAVIIYTL